MVSMWRDNVQPLPERFIFPPEIRPGDDLESIPLCNGVPVIDMARQQQLVEEMSFSKFCKLAMTSAFFSFWRAIQQVINHGNDQLLLGETMEVMKEFFELPDEEKARFYFDPRKDLPKKAYCWRENLQHPCHLLDDYNESWPDKPIHYRKIVGSYSVEVRKLSLRILGLFCEGLGLEQGYFDHELTQDQVLSANLYPPCPDPSLALGLTKHCDCNLITILYQGDVYGLQVLKNHQRFGVEPLPNAFVINVGHQLQIISNGKLTSAEHRVITNTTEPRMTIATFITPSDDCVIEPAKPLVSEESPQVFKSFIYKDFFLNYLVNLGDTDGALRPYKFQKAAS